MNAQWCLPSLDPAYRVQCLATMDPAIRQRCLVIDNAPLNMNAGVAASWNRGIDIAQLRGAEWLVICSESMRFGSAGGRDFEEALDGDFVQGNCDRTCRVVEETGQGICRYGYGWHLTGLRMTLVDRVGRFDEIFYPAWWEDTDYLRRMGFAGIGEDQRRHVNGLDAHLIAAEHSYRAGLIPSSWSITQPFYEAKWGKSNPDETFDRPYDNPLLDWTHTGPPPL